MVFLRTGLRYTGIAMVAWETRFLSAPRSERAPRFGGASFYTVRYANSCCIRRDERGCVRVDDEPGCPECQVVVEGLFNAGSMDAP